MNIIFLTLLDFNAYEENNIYCDFLRELIKNNHNVYCISPVERRFGIETHQRENGRLLKLKIGNIQKTNILEKGLSMIMLEKTFISAVKRYFSDVNFDLVIYATPPITLGKVVSYIKKRDQATTYLMLKDIFPQNAVDLGLLTKRGIRSALYKYFRRKEKRLYEISDRIGCMSPANMRYVLDNNPQIAPDKIELCPNACEVKAFDISETERIRIREKYGIPIDKKVFIYGGNLGKPQCIPHIIDCLKAHQQNKNIYFLIVGDGTEFKTLQAYFESEHKNNMQLIRFLPREEYECLVAACDVGLIFLDHKFTIPNFPSRILSYMQAKIPVLACTDRNSDVGKVILQGEFGWWCESTQVDEFNRCIQNALTSNLKLMGENGYRYLQEHYSVCRLYKKMEYLFE